MKKNHSFLIIFFFLFSVSYSQINYTCDFDPSGCGASWDNNGFADGTGHQGASWGCDGDNNIYDNVWSGDSRLLAYNSSYFTDHQGGDITISFIGLLEKCIKSLVKVIIFFTHSNFRQSTLLTLHAYQHQQLSNFFTDN